MDLNDKTGDRPDDSTTEVPEGSDAVTADETPADETPATEGAGEHAKAKIERAGEKIKAMFKS